METPEQIIKRLETERDAAIRRCEDAQQGAFEAIAHAAAMRAALKKCDDYLTSGTITCSIGTGSMGHEWIRQALATDSGKAAADVLAALGKYFNSRAHGHPDAKYWWEDVEKTYAAYRNEGRDDG